MGAVLARKTLGYADFQDKKHFRAVTIAGLIILAAFVIDLAISIQQSGWHNIYLLLALTPTGLGALLLYAGSKILDRPSQPSDSL